MARAIILGSRIKFIYGKYLKMTEKKLLMGELFVRMPKN